MPERFRLHEGWLSLILLFLLLLTVTISLQAAKWATGLDILNSTLLGAFLLGYLFSKSRLSGLLLHPLAMAAGVLWIGYLSLRLVTEGPWDAQVAELIIRVVLWSRQISTGDPSFDTLPFTITMAGLVWLLGYGATWDFFRARHIWGVLLPSGITILVNTYYARENLVALLMFFMVLAFLLVIRTTLFERELQWRRRHVTYSSDIQFDFMREGAVFALAVVAIAWFLPATIDHAQLNPALTRLTQPWGRAQQEWSRLFGTLNYKGTGGGASFGTSMNFHGPLTRTNNLIMHVRAPEGRYWRAVVRDRYTSAGWTISDHTVVPGPAANTPLPGAGLGPGRERITQQYTIFTPAGTQLYAASQPIEVSMDTRLLLGGPGAQQEQASEDSIAQLLARVVLFQGQSYSVVSAVPNVDIKSLREAGSDYPPALYEQYTQLPDTVPARVGELAQQLTTGLDTPFDKARTLETYLRALPYNELIPGPRPGEDGVDYFLFRERQGYCDYYASSMAVMLRSLGIPARLAQGYNQGSLLDSGVYEIRQLNAHTWVEVYFPGYGWVEFEPTAAEPGIERPGTASEYDYAGDALDATGSTGSIDLSEQEALRQEMDDLREPAPTGFGGFTLSTLRLDPRLLLVPLGILAVLGVIGSSGWALAQRRWRGLDTVERVFDQVGLIGRALGQRFDPTLTPHEYVERVSEQVPPARPPLQRLADLFAKRRFSQTPLAEQEVSEAERSWLEARRSLLHGVANRFKPKRDAATGDGAEQNREDWE